MATLNAKSVARMRDLLKKTQGVTGGYYRAGRLVNAAIVAVPDRPVLQELGGADADMIGSDWHDWLFDPVDLVDADGQFEPQRGDVWQTATRRYEVISRDEPRCWRYNDESEELLRVFTHEIL